MRKIKNDLAGLLIAVMLVGAGSSAYAACVTTFKVPGDGSSIQSGIDVARNTTLSGDHCVVVDNGTYNEAVTIDSINTDNHRVIIVSSPSATVMVQPPNGSNAIFNIKNASVTISGINIAAFIANSSQYGIQVSSDSSVISSVNINGYNYITSAGLFIESDHNQVLNSTISASAGGVPAVYLSAASNNLISQSYISTFGSGIAISGGSAYNTISFSTVTITAGGGTGCSVNNASATIITDSYLYSEGSVVLVVGSTGTIINSSVLANSSGWALNLGGSVNLSLLSSVVSGINIGGSNSGLLIFSSNTIGGGSYGISFFPLAEGAKVVIASMTFQALMPGATAINFPNSGIFVSTFSDVVFADANLGVNVNGSLLAFGSDIRMLNATGVKAGAAFEHDSPTNFVHWGTEESAGAFSGDFLNGGSDYNGGPAQNGVMQYGVGIAVDTITAGGPFTYVVMVSSAGASADYLTVKYNAAGVKVSSVAFAKGSSFNERPAIAVGPGGYVYVAADVAEGSKLHPYSYSGLLLRYNSDLNQASMVSTTYDAAGGGAFDTFYGVAADAAGNVYVTGTSNNGYGGAGDQEIVTIKYDSALVFVSSSIFNVSGTGLHDIGYGIAADSGNVYVTGMTNNAPSSPSCVTLKYSKSMTFISSASFVNGSGLCYAVAPSEVFGAVFVAGQSNNGSNWDSFIAKYDNNLVLKSSAGYNGGYDDSAYGLAADRFGDIYVTGKSNNAGNSDYVLFKFNQYLTFLSSDTHDSGYNDIGYSLAVDTAPNLYAAAFTNNGTNDVTHTMRYYQKGLGGTTVYVSSANISQTYFMEGVEAAAFRGTIYTAYGETPISNIRVHVNPAGPYGYISSVGLYVDNFNGVWEPGIDSLVSSAAVISGYVDLPIFEGIVDSNPHGFFLTLTPGASAVGSSVNLAIDSADAFTVGGVMAAQQIYPMTSAATTVQSRFTGDFSQQGGANFDGGDMDIGLAAAFYNSNVYVVGISSPTGGILVKYDASGNKVSSATFAGIELLGVVANSNGIYATAQGEQEMGFITLKYTHDLVFVSSAVLAGEPSARNLAADAEGNIYVVGSDNLQQGSLEDYKFVKYDSNLELIGSPVIFDAGGNDEGRGIAVDNGNVYVTGDSLIGGATYFVTVKFDSNSMTWLSSAVYSNAYTSSDLAPGGKLAVNPNTHEVYFVGTSGTENDRHILTIRYSQDLQQLSTAVFTGAAVYQLGAGITLDATGYVYTLGKDGSSTDYPVLIKYNPNLDLMSSTESIHYYMPLAVAPDPVTGESYVTGFYISDGSKDMSKADMRTVKLPALADGTSANHNPVLSWTGDVKYESGGLNYATGNTSMWFVYRMKYTDQDNDPPLSAPELYITNGGGAVYVTGLSITNGGGGPYAMSELDPGDTTYSDGKVYTYSTMLDVGAGYGYYFVAQDSHTASAVGDPTITNFGPVVESSQTLTYQTGTHLSAGVTAQLLLTSMYQPYYNAAIAKDQPGNIYTAQIISSNSANTLALAKYNFAGGDAWTRFMPMPSGAYSKDISVDAAGNSYVLSGINYGSGLSIAKYDARGAELWTSTWTSGNMDMPGAIRVTPDGKAYVASYHYDSVAGGSKIVLLKYNALGAPVGAPVAYQSVPGGSSEYAYSLALVPGATTFIYVAGASYLNGGNNSGLLLKYADVSKTLVGPLWTAKYDSHGFNTANAVAVDQFGNIYVTGQEERGDIQQGYNMWLAKYDASGTQRWVKTYNSGSYTYDNANALAVDNLGNVYIAGQVDMWSSGEGENFWLGEYNPIGNLIMVRNYNSGGSNTDHAYAITAGSASVYVMGSFTDYSGGGQAGGSILSGLYIMPTVAGGGGGTPAPFLSAMEGPYTGSVALSWNYPMNLLPGSSFYIQSSSALAVAWNPARAQVVVATAVSKGDMQNYTYGGLMTGRNPDQSMAPNYMFRVWLSSASGSYTLMPAATSYAKTPFAYDNTQDYGQDRMSYLSNVQIGTGTGSAIALEGNSVYQAFGNNSGDSVGLGFRKYNLNSYVEWTRFFNTAAGAYYSVNSMVRDSAGNFYAVGSETPVSSPDNRNIWLGKFSAAGNLLWSYSDDINGGYDELHDAALDGAGGLYVAGEYGNAVGKGAHIFARKYNVSASSYASVSWTYTESGFAADGDDGVYGVAVDTVNARVYFTGVLTNASGNSDLWVRKMMLDNTFVSSFTYDSGSGNDYGYGVAVNASGVYVAGSKADFGKQSIYMARYPLALGATVWALTSGPQGNSEMYSIKLDGAGNVYGAGYETSATGKNAVYGKLDPNGNLLWGRSFNDNNSYGDTIAYGIKVDASGMVCSALYNKGYPGFYVFPQQSFDLQAEQYYVPGSVKLHWMSPLTMPAGSPRFYIQYSTYQAVSWSTAAAQVSFSAQSAVMQGTYQEKAVFGLDNGRDAQGMSIAPVYYFKLWISSDTGVVPVAVNGTPSAKASDAYPGENMAMYPGDARLYTIGSNMNNPSPAGMGMEMEFNGVAKDMAGNIYMVANSNWNGSGLFVLKKFKFDLSGLLVLSTNTWTRSYTPGESYSVKAEKIAADASGNLYVTGYEINQQGATGKDLFLMKFNSDSSLAWKYTSSASGDDMGYAVAVDTGARYAYVAGSSGTVSMEDIYIAKFNVSNATGPVNPVWTVSYAGTGNGSDIAYGITVRENNVYAVGSSNESGGRGASIWAGRYDASNVNTPYTTTISNNSGSAPEAAYDVAVDSSGYVYVAGETINALYPDRPNNDGVIYKSSADLSDFGAIFGVYDSQIHANDAAYGLVLDVSGGIYAVGMEERYDLNQDKNLWIRKYGSDSSELWMQTFNSNNTNGGVNFANADVGLGVAVDNSGFVYVSGRFGANGGMYRYKQSNPSILNNPTLNVVVKRGSSNSTLTTDFPGVVVALIPFSQTGGIDASRIITGTTNANGVFTTKAPAGRQYFIALSTQGWIPTIQDQQMDPYGHFFVQLNGDVTPPPFILYPRPEGDPAYPLTVTITSAAANDSVMAEIFYMQTGEKVAYGISQIAVGRSSVTFTVPNVSPADANIYSLGITIPNKNIMKSILLDAAFPRVKDAYTVSMSTVDGAIAAFGGFDAGVSTNPASLEGVVRDRTYASPITGARVSIYHRGCGMGNNPQYDDYETLSDVNGRFSFYDVPHSTIPYQVEVKKSGYSRGGYGGCWWDSMQSVYVPNGITVSGAAMANYQEFSLDQATFTFKAIITYNGVPVPNASVMVYGDYNWYSSGSSSDVYRQNGGINTDANIKTGADGSFTFSSATFNGLLEGGLRLQVAFFGNWTDINRGANQHSNGDGSPDYDDIRIVLSGQRSLANLDNICTVGKVWVLKASDGSCMTAATPETALTFNIEPAGGNATGSLSGKVVFVTTYTVSAQNPLIISTSAPVTVMASQDCNGGCNGNQSVGFTSLSGTYNVSTAAYSITLSTGVSYYAHIVSADWGQITSFDSSVNLSSTDTARMDFTVGRAGVLKGSIKLPNGNNFKPYLGNGNNDPAEYSAEIQLQGKNVDVNTGSGIDNNGEFEFPNIAPGIYDITLKPQGAGFVWVPINLTGVSVTAGKTTEVKLQLTDGLVVQPQILGLPDISTPTWQYVIVPVPSGTEMNQKKITEMFFGKDATFTFNYSTNTRTWDKKYMLPGQYDFYLMLAAMYNPGDNSSQNQQTSYDQFGNFIGKVKGVAVQKFEANPSLGSYNQPIPVNILGSIGQGGFNGTVKGARVFTDADVIRIFANFENEITRLIPAVMIYDSAGDLKGYAAAMPSEADFPAFWAIMQNRDASALKNYFFDYPGRFMIAGLPPGRYTAVFSNPNYPPVAKEIELPKEGYALDFEAQHILAGSISGTVLVSGSSEPVANAAIYLKHRIVEKFTKTDDTGHFSFSNLPSGIYRMEISKDGFVTTGDKTSLSGSDNVQFSFYMTPSGSKITGKVYLSKFPSPLTKAGISIVAYDETLNVNFPNSYLPKIAAITNASGEYELTGIIPGHIYKVSAFYSGKRTATPDPITAVEGDTYMDDIVLKDMPPQIIVKVKKSPDSTSKADVIIASPKQLVATPVCKFNPSGSTPEYLSASAVSLALVPGPNNTYLGQFTVSKNQRYYTVYFSAGDNNKMEKIILYDQNNAARTEQYIQDEAIQGGEVQMDKETEEYSGLELDPGALSYSTTSAAASFQNLVGGFFSALPSVRTVKTAKGNLTIEAAIQSLMASEVYNMDLSNASANKPFTLTLKYDKDKGANSGALKIYQYDEATGSWKPVPGNYTIDPMLGVLSVDVASLDNAYEGAAEANTPLGRKKFKMSAVVNGRYVPSASGSSQGGKFAVFTAKPGTGITYSGSAFDIYNMPNPFTLKAKDVIVSADGGAAIAAGAYSTKGTLIKYHLPPGNSGDVKFVIYNMAGEKVRTIDDGARAGGQVYYSEWDGKNDNASDCASGVYFMLTYLDGKTLSGRAHKMAIIK
ncbi:MAG TPA: hypothetical protein DCL44_09990 [Elusimicrobia bacterium]|nr:hypothetical protein [Elusimicrobiota bacterium]